MPMEGKKGGWTRLCDPDESAYFPGWEGRWQRGWTGEKEKEKTKTRDVKQAKRTSFVYPVGECVGKPAMARTRACTGWENREKNTRNEEKIELEKDMK